MYEVAHAIYGRNIRQVRSIINLHEGETEMWIVVASELINSLNTRVPVVPKLNMKPNIDLNSVLKIVATKVQANRLKSFESVNLAISADRHKYLNRISINISSNYFSFVFNISERLRQEILSGREFKFEKHREFKKDWANLKLSHSHNAGLIVTLHENVSLHIIARFSLKRVQDVLRAV